LRCHNKKQRQKKNQKDFEEREERMKRDAIVEKISLSLFPLFLYFLLVFFPISHQDVATHIQA
jgi:hypothetical protein